MDKTDMKDKEETLAEKAQRFCHSGETAYKVAKMSIERCAELCKENNVNIEEVWNVIKDAVWEAEEEEDWD